MGGTPLAFLPALVCALALALAAPASAATFCVHADPAVVCPAGSTDSGGNLQSALDTAEANNQPDTVLVFGGLYDGGLAGFTYTATADEPIAIERAAGARPATLSAFGSGTVLDVAGDGSAPTTVTGLDIAIGSGRTRGIDLSAGATGRDLAISAPGALGSVEGAQLATGATLDASSIDLPSPSSGASTGIVVPAGPVTVTDTRVRADRPLNASAAAATLQRDRFEALGDFPVAEFGGPGQSRIEDSLFSADTDDGGLVVTDGSATVRNLTLVGEISATGIAVSGDAGVTVKSSIVDGFATSVSQAGSSTVAVEFSHLATATGGTVNVTNPVNGGPGFVDRAGGDFRLRPDSPLIDAGNPGGLEAGESATDLVGTARLLDWDGDCTARRDVGAYEREPGPRAPRATATAAPGEAATGAPVSFDAGGSCDPDGDSLTYSWSFDDGGSDSGSSVQHAFASGGPHTGTVTVTDSTGRSSTASARVTVTAPPPEQPPPDQPPPPGPPPGPRPGTCINVVMGTSAAETLTGSAFGDVIQGFAGGDRINGADGEDCLLGGAGNDRLDGAAGNDDVRGEAGNDTVVGGEGADLLSGSSGRDRLVGGAGFDALDGGSGNDSLSGGSGLNSYTGGSGNDRISAANGTRERVNCGRGRDVATVDRRDRVSGCERVRRR